MPKIEQKVTNLDSGCSMLKVGRWQIADGRVKGAKVAKGRCTTRPNRTKPDQTGPNQTKPDRKQQNLKLET